MVAIGRCCVLVVAAWALGCAPALNWRQARLVTGALLVLLPCKPDRAQREVAMGGQALQLDMLGCKADGATFAVSHVQVQGAEQAGPLLDGWKRAVLTRLAAVEVREAPWTPAAGLPLPQAVRLQARTGRAVQEGLAVEAAWFARVDGPSVHLFHAVLLAPAPRPEVAETFFSSLSLPAAP